MTTDNFQLGTSTHFPAYHPGKRRANTAIPDAPTTCVMHTPGISLPKNSKREAPPLSGSLATGYWQLITVPRPRRRPLATAVAHQSSGHAAPAGEPAASSDTP